VIAVDVEVDIASFSDPSTLQKQKTRRLVARAKRGNKRRETAKC